MAPLTRTVGTRFIFRVAQFQIRHYEWHIGRSNFGPYHLGFKKQQRKDPAFFLRTIQTISGKTQLCKWNNISVKMSTRRQFFLPVFTWILQFLAKQIPSNFLNFRHSDHLHMGRSSMQTQKELFQLMISVTYLNISNTQGKLIHILPVELRKLLFPIMNNYVPIGSMYGIFTYIWLIFMVNVGIYTIHGRYGYVSC